ncbi:MAG TPA: ABC transporter ATP-binding protein [Candidatus Limnocylindria bacterium]|nr:ABC transporter ATP-binding protein [Candidatus Limnocylindria bacterium]
MSVAFGTGSERVLALEDVSFSVEAGEFVTIVGASGSGKTTLLRAVDGLIPFTGRIAIDGEAIRGPGRDRAFVFQSDCLLPWRTVIDNVAFSLELRGVRRRDARETARRYLALTGLEDAERKFPAELSGGMRQRVNLARALAVDPEMLLMDEPFAALDAQTREVMQLELLTTWQRSRKTVLFVTHQLDEAVYLGDRAIVLSARPGHVRATVEIPFARPRPIELKHTPEFAAKVDELWRLIRDEVLSARRV